MSGTGALLLVAALGLVSLVVGRLFTGALGGTLFRRLTPAAAASSLLIGTAVLTLLSVGLSGVGFPTRDLPPLVAALLLPLPWICFRRRRLDVLLPRGGLTEWGALGAPLAATGLLGLLPVLTADGFLFGNDTYTYCAFSEWLQGHGFSEPARWEVQSPVTAIPHLWQSQHYDLGIAHWLGLVQAAVRPASSLLVYPSVSTFGLVLLAAALWLAARQLLRLPASWAFSLALVFALVPHALYWGHHNGFLQQGYALPLVVFGLVLLCRVGARHREIGGAALLALPFAFLASVYLPLLPLLGFAATCALVPLLPRARARGTLRELIRFVAAAAAFTMLYAARDLLSALSPLHGFATSVAGGHIPWGPADFVQFALGTRVLAPGWANVEAAPWSALNRALVPLYVGLVLAGSWHAVRRPRTRPLVAAAALIALGASYYAVLVADPWSGQRGHTWNLFKLAQWGWPFVLLLAVVGVRRLAPTLRGPRLAALALAVVLPASQLGVHWPWSVRLGEAMREIVPRATLARLGALKQQLGAQPPGTLLVVGRPVNAHRWLATAISLLAYPRAVVADWSDSASVSNHPEGGEQLYASLLEHWNEPQVVPILAGYVPFQPDRAAELGGGLALLAHGTRPLVVHVVNPAGLDRDTHAGRPSFALGKGRTKLVVFSPQAQPAELRLELRPYPGRPGTRLVVFLAGGDYSHRSVRQASEGIPMVTLALSGETTLRIPLSLPRGLSTVVLVVDEGRGELDAREPVTVVQLSLEAAAAGATSD